MAGIHRRQQVTDLSPAYLAHDEPVGTHAQRLANKISKTDRASQLCVCWSSLDPYDMGMVRRQLPRVLNDDDSLVGRHESQKCCKQCRLPDHQVAAHKTQWPDR